MSDSPKTRAELEAFLAELGIAFAVVEHPPLYTVADSKALRGTIAGAHTKNLFLRDRKDRLFLLTMEEEAAVDLKTIHSVIGASGKVSFGKPEALLETLGVVPGAVTVLGAANDRHHRLTIVIDEFLMRQDLINAHPLVNDATLSLTPSDLLRFLEATGHRPLVLKIAG